MKQSRLMRHLERYPVDAILDNALLPAVYILVLIAYICAVSK